jgi:hypothetical protein
VSALDVSEVPLGSFSPHRASDAAQLSKELARLCSELPTGDFATAEVAVPSSNAFGCLNQGQKWHKRIELHLSNKKFAVWLRRVPPDCTHCHLASLCIQPASAALGAP